VCRPPATCASSCPGCCSGETCLGGTAPDACGQAGASCTACRGTQTCTSQTCTDTPVTTDGGSGDPCVDVTQCQGSLKGLGGNCISEFTADGGPSGYPGGYCSSVCLSLIFDCPDAPQGLCRGTNCVGRCSGAGTGRGTCRQGYVCAVLTTGDPGGYCTPNCNNAGRNCGTGQTTCRANGYCQ
jgi:hypothetical protein